MNRVALQHPRGVCGGEAAHPLVFFFLAARPRALLALACRAACCVCFFLAAVFAFCEPFFAFAPALTCATRAAT